MNTKVEYLPTVAIVGFGSLGAMFASLLAEHLPFEKLRIVADSQRVNRYKQQGLVVNGSAVELNYVDVSSSATDTSVNKHTPADLVIVCTKFYHLDSVLPLIQSQLGAQTLIVSALNGISSEEVLANAFGSERIVHCVAQQMDAHKDGNQLIYRDAGQLVIGEMNANNKQEQHNVQRVASIFKQLNFPHSISPDMPKNMWGKLMLNTGVNQTVAFYEGTFDTVQQEGAPREMFRGAMREVMTMANLEGVNLTEDDFNQWVEIMDNLVPTGMPSLRQDLKAGRECEVELFAGFIRTLGKKHGVATPINDKLYDGIYALMGKSVE